MSGQRQPSAAGRPRWIAGAVALGAGLVLVALWLLAGSRGGDETPGAAGHRDASAIGDDASNAAPEFSAAPASLAADGASDAATVETDAAALSTEGSAVARWTGPMSTFTGSVVDHEKRPLAQATVTCWPSAETRRALEMDGYGQCLGPEIDPALQTATRDDGTFVLRAPLAPLKPNKSYIDEQEDFPVLLVEADGYAVRAFICKGLLSGDYDAGTIAVEPGGALIGRVVDERGEPIAAARVHARQGKCRPAHVIGEDDWESYYQIGPVVSDISGTDGRFELGGFWPGSATFSILADGFALADGASEPIEIGARRDLGDIVLPRVPTFELSGLVIDSDSTPVRGAIVLADKADADRRRSDLQDAAALEVARLQDAGDDPVETDAEGRFTLTRLEAANYRLCVGAPGFEPLLVPDVAPGSQVLHLTLVRAASLRLSLIDATTREPVSGATVGAVRRSGEKEAWREPNLPVQPAPEPGTFVIDQVGSWRTDVVVAAKGYATTAFSIDGVKPPETVERTVELQSEARIQGRVLAADGAPIAGAKVATVPVTTAPIKVPALTAESGRDGRFELGGLACGDWTLRADAPGFIRAELPVTIPSSGLLADVDFVLDAGATIFGTRFGADGRPLPGQSVGLYRKVEPHLDGDMVSVATDVHGDYRAEGLRSGRWHVGSAVDQEVLVDVESGQSVRVDLHDSPPIMVRGTVFANGQPRAGVVVMALSRENEKRSGFATPLEVVKPGPDGHYEMKVPRAGEYYIQAGGVDPPCGGSAVVPVALEQGDQRVVDLVFSGERVSVLVVEAGSELPVEGVCVTLVRASEADPLTPDFSFGNVGDRTEFWPYTDAQGRAELPFALPGSYSLRCRVKGHLTATVPIAVIAGKPQDVRVELESAATLRGIVKLSSGVPAQDGLRVTLLREEAPDEKHGWASTESGQFAFDGLRGGDYRLVVWDATTSKPTEKPLLELPVTLKPGEEKSVELQLPP